MAEQKVKFKVNSASHIADLPFRHLKGRSWGDAAPPDRIRDDMAEKFGWKNAFLIVEEREGERKEKLVEYKYPFATKNGTPVFEGLISAWKRAHQVYKSKRGDKYDVQEAKAVIDVLRKVIKKWKNAKGAKGEFYKRHAADWLGETGEAISDPTLVDSFVSELVPSIVRFQDFLGLSVPKRLGQSSAYESGEVSEAEQAEMEFKSAKDLRSYLERKAREKASEEKAEGEMREPQSPKEKALIKMLLTHSLKAKDIPEIKDRETFIAYLKDLKEALKSDRMEYALGKISALAVPVAGRIMGGGVEAPKAFGLALRMIGVSLEDLRVTQAVIEDVKEG